MHSNIPDGFRTGNAIDQNLKHLHEATMRTLPDVTEFVKTKTAGSKNRGNVEHNVFKVGSKAIKVTKDETCGLARCAMLYLYNMKMLDEANNGALGVRVLGRVHYGDSDKNPSIAIEMNWIEGDIGERYAVDQKLLSLGYKQTSIGTGGDVEWLMPDNYHKAYDLHEGNVLFTEDGKDIIIIDGHIYPDSSKIMPKAYQKVFEGLGHKSTWVPEVEESPMWED